MAEFENFLSWTHEAGHHDGMTLFFPELAPLMVWFHRRLDVFKKKRGEEGVTTAEWVVIVAAVVAMALAAAAVIADKVSGKADSIDLG